MSPRAPQGLPDPGDAESEFEQLEAGWPTERPSRRRQRRRRGKQERGPVTVRPVRLPRPNAEHVSRALLAAQRGLAAAQAEADARRDDASKPPRSAESDGEPTP